MSNVIPFPKDAQAGVWVDYKKWTPTPPLEDPQFWQGQRVRFKGTGEFGVIIDGKPNFGIKARWLYYVQVLEGPGAGIVRAVYASSIEATNRPDGSMAS